MLRIILTPFCTISLSFCPSRCLLLKILRVMIRTGPWFVWKGGWVTLSAIQGSMAIGKVENQEGRHLLWYTILRICRAGPWSQPRCKVRSRFHAIGFVGHGSTEFVYILGKILYKMHAHVIRLYIQPFFGLLPTIGIKCATLIPRDGNAEFSDRDDHISWG